MQKGKFKNYFERFHVAEELARKFYKMQGCVAPEEPADYMQKSEHPQEAACYQMALAAIEELMKSYP